MNPILTRTVVLLGAVSLFTDLASEMLYPILPIYLESIGFGVIGIGVLEGIAEATSGLSKGYFGQWSDRLGRRRPFVVWGYGLSAVAKPLLVLFLSPVWILFTRTLDRFGKGIRTGARDALLSGEAVPETKARVFGFHRSMDTLGAALGPLVALMFLYFYPGQYRWLFFLAVVPGLLAVVATLLLTEKPTERVVGARPGLLEFAGYWRRATPAYRRLVVGLAGFALINSSDMFLLLYLKDAGLTDVAVIGYYVFYNLVYAVAAYPFGSLADRFGPKRMFLFGLLCFGLVYAILPYAVSFFAFTFLFLIYGLFAAATDGVAKAWITHTCAQADTATAIGAYSALASLCSLVASSAAGGIWYGFGPTAMLTLTAAATVGIVAYFLGTRAR
ncbi:MFS family permease [Lewinella aquimaris]|uniref:MFS family permease n=1 Tax=Neolewinella aquimaris TaxID=1835722 RepID=A0A840E4M6_9BACT|nr:MFS transporter [Neolewinella aquimaris]MBB4078692.1 MFS family permease [Neolewinella aquimaris]